MVEIDRDLNLNYDARDADGWTELFKASRDNEFDQVVFLIEKGASLNPT